MIVATLTLRPSPNRRAEVLEILRSVRGPVLVQPGCRACGIFEDLGLVDTIVLVERWDSDAALRAHVRSEAFRYILGALELSDSPPDVCFDHVTAIEGFALIERWRKDLAAGGEVATVGATSPGKGAAGRSRGKEGDKS